MSAAITALFAGLDVDVAIKTANNAVDHNFLIAALPWLISAGLTAWAACDVYDTYKTQGTEAAVKQLVTMGIITAVTAGTGQLVYKIGSKVLGKTADAAWKAYLAESPVLSKMIEKGAAAFGKVKDKVTNSKAFQQAAKLDAKLDKALDKGKEKISEKLGRGDGASFKTSTFEGEAKSATQYERYKASLAQEEALNSVPIGSALKSDAYHQAAHWGINSIKYGRQFTIKGKDGQYYNLSQMEGSYNNVEGVFEYITSAGNKLTHQRFIPNGVITGTPNQIPK